MPHLEPVFVPSLASSSEVPAENVSTDTKGRVDIHEEIDSDGGREDRVEVYPEDLSNGPRADNGGGGGGGGSEGDIEEREDSNDERTRRRTSTRREHSQKAQSTPVSASRTAADISSSASWSDALESFLEAADDSATRDGHGPGVIDAFGVFGEGSLPPPGLAAAIESLWPALDRSTAPTAILSRSRLWVDSGRTHADSGGRDRWSEEHDGDWLPDTFISQVIDVVCALVACVVTQMKVFSRIAQAQVCVVEGCRSPRYPKQRVVLLPESESQLRICAFASFSDDRGL